MKIQKIRENRKMLAISGLILLIISAYLLGKTASPLIKNYIIMGGIFLATGVAAIWIFRNRKTINIDYILQLIPISFTAALFWNLSMLSKYSNKSHILYMMLGEIIFNFLLLELLIIWFDRGKKITPQFKKYGFLLLIYLFFLVCILPTCASWLGLDGVQYYYAIRSIKNWDFINIFALQLCGHISQGYSILALIGEYLFPNQVIGVTIINIILAFVSIFAFYKIVEKTSHNMTNIEKALCTSLFAFSPMLMGMIHEINLDFPLLCFFTCMVSAYIYHKDIWMMCFSILLCFSKEPGIILYGMFMLGILTGRIWDQRKGEGKIIFHRLISREIIMAAIGGTLWIALYLGNANKSWVSKISTSTQDGSVKAITGTFINTFSFDLDYILVRIKEMLFINFTWLIVLIAIWGTVFIVLQSPKKAKSRNISLEIFFAIGFSFIGFLFYNCFYVTWIHYRYLIGLTFFISFFYTVIYGKTRIKKEIKLIVTSFLACLIIVSNFLTIDPISTLNFNTYDTGKTSLVVPCVMAVDSNGVINLNRSEIHSGNIGDAIYNLEYSYFCIGFEKMMNELDYKDDKLILIHGDRLNCFFEGYKLTDNLYWDSTNKHLNINTYDICDETDRFQHFNIKMLKNVSDIRNMDLSAYSEIYLLDFPLNENVEQGSISNCEYWKKFEYRMWSWDIYKIKSHLKFPKKK